MTDFEHETEVPVTDYGQWRYEQERARQRASAEVMMAMLDGAGQADFQGTHDHLTRSKHGLYGASTGQQLAQSNAEQQPTVGGEWSLGRPLERNGDLAWSYAPAPKRVYLSQVNEYPGLQQGGVSPLLRHMRGEQ